MKEKLGFLNLKIPRITYYMDLGEPLVSFVKLIFRIGFRRSDDVDKFERKLADKFDKRCVCTPNARYALDLILDYLDVSSEDHVILSPINLLDMKKIVNRYTQKITWAFYEDQSFEIDLEAIKNPELAKVFIYTPISGISMDLKLLKSFCDMHGLILIMDLTQSFMGRYSGELLTNYSDYCFHSLCDLKVIHTHRGGFITTRDDKLIRHSFHRIYKELKEPDFFAMFKVYLEDLFSVVFSHPKVFSYLTYPILLILKKTNINFIDSFSKGEGIKIGCLSIGKSFFNSEDIKEGQFSNRLLGHFCDYQAQIGLKKLENFEAREAQRIKNTLLFYDLLVGKAREAIPKFVEDSGHVYWKCPLYIDSPECFIEFCFSRGLDCATTGLKWMPELKTDETSSENMRNNIVYIPLHYYLKENHVSIVSRIVNKYFNEKND